MIFTGSGKSGSWRVRGEQLGAALGARVEKLCTNFSKRDLVVYVKRMRPEILTALRQARARWVWDVVDAWPQPEGNWWGMDQATTWLRSELSRLQPHAVVFTTEAMRLDSDWQGPSLVLPHHAWPRYDRQNDFRPEVKVLGYEGNDYLGAWEKRLRDECSRRGWRFEINGNMRHCDIGVALREADGWPARRWKSNVKLANLQALGIPALCSPETGYLEFARGAEVFVENPANLKVALDMCAGEDARKRARRVEAITISRVAKEYKTWLTALNS